MCKCLDVVVCFMLVLTYYKTHFVSCMHEVRLRSIGTDHKLLIESVSLDSNLDSELFDFKKHGCCKLL